MTDNDYEQNVHDITSMTKDGMITTVDSVGPDGLPKKDYIINPKLAYYSTQSINSDRFGLCVEAIEDLDVLGEEAKYHMSEPRAAVMNAQIKLWVNDVMKNSIAGKSSETMRDKRTAQTSRVDKYLKRSQERIIDLKGDMKQKGMVGLFGSKEAERDD